MTSPLIKICGISTVEAVDVATQAGADMLGFVYHPTSPRHLPIDAMTTLREHASKRVQTVIVVVNPDDALVEELAWRVRPDYFQLHGNEPPERVAQLSARFGIRVIKALSVSHEDDIARAKPYEAATDMLLFDAKTNDAAMPGGKGIVFDWHILSGYKSLRPWLIAGGIGAHNALDALHVSGAGGLDASSMLESAYGVKDPKKIRAFIQAVRSNA